MLKLIIEDDEGKTTVVPLIRDEISIGRKEGNTIRLTERNVSRRHARLLRQNGGTFLEDLNSYNGIKVNGSRIEGQVTVAEGDRIQIGDYMLALKLDQPAEQAPSDPFDDMKTVPVEKAEAQAMANHLAQQQGETMPAAGAEPAPAAAPDAEAPAPASEAEPAAAPAEQQRDLIAEASESTSAAPAARLVVVSSNFAGMECPLDKAAQVIGRTPDNDVVIDHRSVSKHHAKVVREGTSYTIIDQGSSNGLFVNGEKYDRVELRPGDMVDLGHVRMRFVGADEGWVFDPSTAVDTGPEEKKSNVGLIAVLGMVGAAVLVAVLFGTGVFGGGESKEASADDASGQAAAMTADSDVSSSAMASEADYKAVRDAIAAKDWKTAIREADGILINNQGDTQARKLRQKAVDEQKNEEQRNGFFKALRAGNWKDAVFQGTQVDKDSVYHAEVSKRLGEVEKKYRKQLIAQAKQAHQSRQCSRLEDLAREMKTLAPSETAITELQRSCQPTKDDLVAMGMDMDPPDAMEPDIRRHRPMRPRRRVVRPPMDRRQPPPRRRRPAAGGASAAKLLADARAALMANQHGRAIRLARASIKKKWSSSAWAVLGVAACKANRRSTARTAYKALRGGKRSMLVSVCKSVGINLP
jgi:pSer/pThr/pTyr-binding forkhead associated (FHA) protein